MRKKALRRKSIKATSRSARFPGRACCTFYALGADRPRKIIALDAKRGLIGRIVLSGEETSPVRMKLAKSASFRGRAVDADGAPLADTEIIVDFKNETISELYRFCKAQADTLMTDKSGRFEMKHVVPAERFSLYLTQENMFQPSSLTA